MEKKSLTGTIDIRRIDVIPGIRVLAIGLIAWFHIWQQSWLTPYIRTPKMFIDLMALPRAGYLWVDMFILLSAFQLFLPYVRRMMDGGEDPSLKAFYSRRAWRIMPSYYFSIGVSLVWALGIAIYPNAKVMLVDLMTHLTFTHTFKDYTYLWTNLNVVLWTVAILMQFYLIFPLIVRLFRKNAQITMVLMMVIGIGFRALFVNNSPSPAMYVNQVPAFMDVFALGMMGAYLTVYIHRKVDIHKISILQTFLSIVSLGVIYMAMRSLSGIMGHENIQRWQGVNRLWVAAVFMIFVVSTTFSIRPYRWIFSNKVMVYLASVSYNYYIWHQYIAVKLRYYRIPPSIHENPNMAGDRPWQYIFTAVAFLLPLLVSIVLTWAIDQKLVGWLRNRKNNRQIKAGL